MKKIAVITGDIVNSRKGSPDKWLSQLKDVLKRYGKSPLDWEIVRGDNFQLKISVELALKVAFHIKSAIRQSGPQDVRMAIGIGEESHQSDRISESSGSAYFRSGGAFETLKKDTLKVKSENEQKDEAVNLMLKLAQLSINQWKSTTSEVIGTVIQNPNLNQMEIAKILNKSQSSISEALNRGGFDEIMLLNEYFEAQYTEK